jgi:hypothetical protein
MEQMRGRTSPEDEGVSAEWRRCHLIDDAVKWKKVEFVSLYEDKDS